jgi:hypothetical protein
VGLSGPRRTLDPATTTNLAEGPLTTAASLMRWDSPGYAAANVMIVALVAAILAVWAVPVEARPIPAARHGADRLPGRRTGTCAPCPRAPTVS